MTIIQNPNAKVFIPGSIGKAVIAAMPALVTATMSIPSDPINEAIADIDVKAAEMDAKQPAIKVMANTIDLTKVTVCVKLNRGSFGNRRKVADAEYEIDADKDMINVTKKLLDSPELAAIDSLDGEVDRWLERRCLPFLQAGIKMIPKTVLEVVNTYFQAKAQEREALVDAFIAAYPARVAEAATKLKGQHVESEYLPAEEVRKRFYFFWQYLSFGVPDIVKEVSEKVWEQESHKAQAQMVEASANIQAVMAEAMTGLVSHMAKALEPGADGKQKRFHSSTLTNLTEFLETFDFRNVTDDKELAAVVAKTRTLLKGVDADNLKEQDTVRDKVQAGMATLAAQLDGMVVKVGGRKFRIA